MVLLEANIPMYLASCNEAVNMKMPTRGKQTPPFSGFMAIIKWRQVYNDDHELDLLPSPGVMSSVWCFSGLPAEEA